MEDRETARMRKYGESKRLELWWQLYRTSLLDFCWHECTNTSGWNTLSSNLIIFHSKTGLSCWYNVTGYYKVYLDAHVRCLIFLPNFNKSGIPQRIFRKVHSTKFYLNQPGASHADTCGQMYRCTDRTKVTGTFWDCSNAPKKCTSLLIRFM